MTESTTAPEWVVIERSFDAPMKLIWKMWTDADHFKKWYGPNGFTIPVADMDVRVGGKRHICMEMETPERTMTMWTIGKFTAVNPVTELAYTESMSDKDGNVVDPASMGMPGYPAETTVKVVLETVDSATKMTMTHEGVPAGSPGAGGWNQAFDKLAEIVS